MLIAAGSTRQRSGRAAGTDAGAALSLQEPSNYTTVSTANRPRKWLESSAPLGLAVSGFLLYCRVHKSLRAAVFVLQYDPPALLL